MLTASSIYQAHWIKSQSKSQRMKWTKQRRRQQKKNNKIKLTHAYTPHTRDTNKVQTIMKRRRVKKNRIEPRLKARQQKHWKRKQWKWPKEEHETCVVQSVAWMNLGVFFPSFYIVRSVYFRIQCFVNPLRQIIIDHWLMCVDSVSDYNWLSGIHHVIGVHRIRVCSLSAAQRMPACFHALRVNSPMNEWDCIRRSIKQASLIFKFTYIKEEYFIFHFGLFWESAPIFLFFFLFLFNSAFINLKKKRSIALDFIHKNKLVSVFSQSTIKIEQQLK